MNFDVQTLYAVNELCCVFPNVKGCISYQLDGCSKTHSNGVTWGLLHWKWDCHYTEMKKYYFSCGYGYTSREVLISMQIMPEKQGENQNKWLINQSECFPRVNMQHAFCIKECPTVVIVPIIKVGLRCSFLHGRVYLFISWSYKLIYICLLCSTQNDKGTDSELATAINKSY